MVASRIAPTRHWLIYVMCLCVSDHRISHRSKKQRQARHPPFQMRSNAKPRN
jgi:hypothetical protein